MERTPRVDEIKVVSNQDYLHDDLHSGDFALSLGLLWLYLSNRASTEVVLIFVAFFGSMLGSHVLSRAGMVGIEAKEVGLVTRIERILILSVGLFTHWTTIALWILAVLNPIAALQRIICVVHVSLLQKRESVLE